MDLEASPHSRLVVPMVLAIILDGVPESIVIGLGITEGGAVSLAMLVAVFISNLPEAIAGSIGMKAGGAGRGKIILLWFVIVLVCAVASVAGYSLFRGLSDRWLAFVQALAGGAILMMLANSMIPEAYEHGGKLAGYVKCPGPGQVALRAQRPGEIVHARERVRVLVARRLTARTVSWNARAPAKSPCAASVTARLFMAVSVSGCWAPSTRRLMSSAPSWSAWAAA